MNGSTLTPEVPEGQLKRKMEDGDLSDDDLPLAVRQKSVGSSGGGSGSKKLKLQREEPVGRLNNGAQSPVKPTIKQEKLSPVKNHLHESGSPNKKPIPQPTGDDSDDDTPLAARAKIKTETADVKKVKVKKSKDGTPLKPVKKSDGKKAEVKKESKKTSKPTKSAAVYSDSDDDDAPLSSRIKTPSSKQPPKGKTSTEKKKKPHSAGSMAAKRKKDADSDSEDDYKPLAKTVKKSADKAAKKEGKPSSAKKKTKKEPADKKPAKEKSEKKSDKKKEEEKEVWKWWEEEKLPDGVKWRALEHKGPYFPPLYEPLPDDIKFYYDGKVMKLSSAAEEVATFYAKMLDHDYTQKDIFNKNFFEDWRKEMTKAERETIKDLKKCGFKEMHAYFVQKNEERKNMSKEEKQVLKKANEDILQEYGFCMMDGHKQRVGNFKIEPPGLFRGRGDHPKQGKLKKRIMAESIIINIGKGVKVPEPPEGHKWMKVIHDPKVTWLACWVENIQGSYKYVMLNPTSRLKGEKDWQKYETARKLKGCVERIRRDYQEDWRCKEMRIRQRGVALYFIDKLALRAGHEKDDDTADTVGCCSLRVEHIKLHEEWEDKENVVEFDFLGKDSVRYWNFVPVERRVFKNLKLFMTGKSEGDDLFDRLTTTSLNKYLTELMEGLTAKVFRTFNASLTLQDQLGKLTDTDENVNAKVLSYNRANRAVAILCNHQRSVPKTFEKTMSNLQTKISDKKKAIKEAKKESKELNKKCKENKGDLKTATQAEKKKNQVKRLEEQLLKLEVTATDKEENKEIALGTSKLNYLDPRITVAWCKKHEVPVEKTYNKTQREKFAWALDMADKEFVF